ncbi:phosphoadenosine phosphosulfate reductase family protein [Deinococcus soli (ex Cha et al. 2016)]|uniref:3'-phosphoadenosine 5'-phosphosulfate sulfotransferase (PAPS reductase)/FAD synthetase n=2 Tax=Deinococcus soli (ex Cha et al. 2016) TaxID=1309411 RepID=A0AAE3XAP5_9DEIO|nr:phosphoadenosine phosphosulfate reductase family protein [Deinococcus soli (ex Cha et al. 2016)]MDR6218280.1 3'-phosphoadenosine 5'-phosphosulfate sulfotransferase (PAPS reductase)/FAD synthetase [Deinococcus soli (ex Cha et al. 2016)]MDR6329020.1 3'-phosphoadenosine 5'-phosphosulfate sulfotransferase (PAPS reductase)/FAD synthetase [Deinococcus soli (ex Cha et al. 2016)]MDR6751293.1 3'-phosphoadenosine 5'-phosphosulfate sulfotransferase (PAPS reductase)/FAD synthetase [Deinococcus soli (ex C
MTITPLSHHDELVALIREGALVVANHSGGKDSQALLERMLPLVPPGQLAVVHAPLGEVEWPGASELARNHAAAHGLPFIEARAGKTFFEMVERRFETRPEVPSFPSAAFRQCTSDLKVSPITREVRKYADAHGFTTIIDCTGIRAEESKRRAKVDPFYLERRLCTKGRRWYKAAPLFLLGEEEVFSVIAASGFERHVAYDLGNDRLSCMFCIMGCKGDLRNAAQFNPLLYAKYVELEHRTGYTMHQSRASLEELTGLQADLSLLGEPSGQMRVT